MLAPTLPHVNVSDCCMLEVVVRGAVGAEWQNLEPCLALGCLEKRHSNHYYFVNFFFFNLGLIKLIFML